MQFREHDFAVLNLPDIGLARLVRIVQDNEKRGRKIGHCNSLMISCGRHNAPSGSEELAKFSCPITGPMRFLHVLVWFRLATLRDRSVRGPMYYEDVQVNFNEDYRPLRRASDFFPGPVSVATLHRWRKFGLHGVRLATVLCGSRRYLSRSAAEDFLAKVTEAVDGKIGLVHMPGSAEAGLLAPEPVAAGK